MDAKTNNILQEKYAQFKTIIKDSLYEIEYNKEIKRKAEQIRDLIRDYYVLNQPNILDKINEEINFFEIKYKKGE